MWGWLVRLFGVRSVPPEIKQAMDTVRVADHATKEARAATDAYWREVQRVDRIIGKPR